MGKYTMTIREIQNSLNGSELLEKALSTYPLYAPTKEYANIPNRSELNRRLLNAYKDREIGFETPGRFFEELKNTMCEIMPYYNEMYKTIEIMANLENPFDNVDFTESYTETRTGTATNENTATTTGEDDSIVSGNTTNTTNTNDESSTSSNVESTSKNIHTGTPQNNITQISASNIDSVSHADDVTWNKTNNSDSASTNGESQSTSTTDNTQTANSSSSSKTDASGTVTTNDTVEHTFTKKGNQGVNTYAHDMIEFRSSIIDVTNMIITDARIKELFLMIF